VVNVPPQAVKNRAQNNKSNKKEAEYCSALAANYLTKQAGHYKCVEVRAYV